MIANERSITRMSCHSYTTLATINCPLRDLYVHFHFDGRVLKCARLGRRRNENLRGRAARIPSDLIVVKYQFCLGR